MVEIFVSVPFLTLCFAACALSSSEALSDSAGGPVDVTFTASFSSDVSLVVDHRVSQTLVVSLLLQSNTTCKKKKQALAIC